MKSRSESLNRFVAELRQRRATRARESGASEHLSDDTLQALADGSLGALETASARTHLAQCLECLNAYGEFRALWDMSETPTASRWRRAPQTLREAIRARVPAWIVPVAATVPIAAVAVLWLRLSSGVGLDSAAPRARLGGVSLTALSERACVEGKRSVSVGTPADTPRSGSGTISRIVQASDPAVVQVVPFGREGKPLNCGSGFFISADGTVVTAAHAVRGARDIFIKIPNGAVFPVEAVLALDSSIDVAIVKVSGHGLPTLKLGDSDRITVGESVVTIGSPFGFESSVSTGIVSGVRRDGDRVLIQTTAPISPGSSGGPLLNQKGEVIGIATSSLAEAQNINFATAINELKKVRDQAGTKTETEKAVQAYLNGVLYMNKNDYAKRRKGPP